MEGMLYLFQNIWKTWCVLFKGRLCTSHGSALLPINETLYQRNVALSAQKNAWRYAAISLKDAAFLQMMTDEKHAVDPLIYFDTVFKKHRLFKRTTCLCQRGKTAPVVVHVFETHSFSNGVRCVAHRSATREVRGRDGSSKK